MTDRGIVCALIDGVRRAVPDGQAETAVTTVITRPLWRRYCRALGQHDDVEPTEWCPPSQGSCWRVYGSRTVVVESEHLAAVSFVAR